MKTRYVLIRTLPDGTEKRQGPFANIRAAAVAASYVLSDNRLASKADAQRFAASLHRETPVGEALRHDASGYLFRITATSE